MKLTQFIRILAVAAVVGLTANAIWSGETKGVIQNVELIANVVKFAVLILS